MALLLHIGGDQMSGCCRAYLSFGYPIIARSIPESGTEGDFCAAVEISVHAGRLATSAAIVIHRPRPITMAAEATSPPVCTGLFPSGC